MAETPGPIGRRLLAATIDHIAENEPNRSWVSVPVNEDLSHGFKDISFKQFAEAINRAAWWLEQTLGVNNGNFETFAYAGEKDVRFPILAVAAIKVGRKILLASPFTTKEAQLHLLRTTECQAYLHSESMHTEITNLLQKQPGIQQITVPEVGVWLQQEKPAVYPYEKTWEKALHDPCMIFHTSGTTGLPKSVIHTNQMLSLLDAAKLMPDAGDETISAQFADGHWHSPVPSLHMVGMSMALLFPVWLGTVFVYGPAKEVPTAAITAQVFQHGRVKGTVLPPGLLEELTKNSEYLECLRQLKYVQYAGAPLSQSVGDKICNDVKLMSCIGSTEVGPYYPKIREDKNWNYLTFREHIGADFEERGDNLYELVFRKKPEYQRWQQIFFVHPHLETFYTNDVFTKHPTREGAWEFAGRLDDMINFSNGQSIRASNLELIIQSDPHVRSALIGGDQRHRPFLLLEMLDQASCQDPQQQMDAVWPMVEKANEQSMEEVHLIKPLTMLAIPSKPLPRTTKGTIARREALKLYQDEINALYEGALRN